MVVAIQIEIYTHENRDKKEQTNGLPVHFKRCRVPKKSVCVFCCLQNQRALEVTVKDIKEIIRSVWNVDGQCKL